MWTCPAFGLIRRCHGSVLNSLLKLMGHVTLLRFVGKYVYITDEQMFGSAAECVPTPQWEQRMHAMMLKAVGAALEWTELAERHPGPGEIRVRVGACGVCRTDLHVVDGELPDPRVPFIPGHEIVGRIDAIGSDVEGLRMGERVGIPWLGHTCGVCPYCRSQRENLCDRPLFTGYTCDGGFATAAIADARFAFPLGEKGSDEELAPLLCAGLIGWRSLVMAGEGKRLGLYGFGAAAHIIAQVAKWQCRSVFAFTRPGDRDTQTFALGLGAAWAGGSDEMPP